MPKIDRTVPPYLQVVMHFRTQIASGALREGDILPSHRQIAADWDISRATALKAVDTLRGEGLVETRQGAGTVVCGTKLHRTAQDHVTTVSTTGRIYPTGYYAKILEAELVEAPDHVAEAFGIPLGSPVVRRRRTGYDDADEPLSTSVSWYAGELAETAPLLLTSDRIKQGTTQYVMEATGRGDRSYHAEVMHAASNATAEEAAELHVPEGDAVERTRNFFRDDQDELIEYGESVYRKENWSYYHTAPKTKESQ